MECHCIHGLHPNACVICLQAVDDGREAALYPEPMIYEEPETYPGRDCEATLEDWQSDLPELTTAERMNCPEFSASLDAANDPKRVGLMSIDGVRMIGYENSDPYNVICDDLQARLLTKMDRTDRAGRIIAPAAIGKTVMTLERVISTRSDYICSQIDAHESRRHDPDNADLAALKALVFELLSPADALGMSTHQIASTLGADPADVWRVLDGSDRYERAPFALLGAGMGWRISWWQRLREKHGVLV